MRSFAWASSAALAVAVVISACGGGSSGNPNTFGGDDAGQTGPDGTAPPYDSGTVYPDGSLLGNGDGTAPPTLTCSSDLHNVIDQNGNVVMVCPPTEGCAAGACVPACQAAADNHGNIGCDFLVATPSFFSDYNLAGYFSPCYAVFLANNWTTPMTVTVSRGGTTYPVSSFGRIPVAGMAETSWPAVPATGVPPGQVAVLFLEEDPNTNYKCPVAPALSQATTVKLSGVGEAWHIVSGAPVSAYDVLPYGGAPSLLPSAELLFPTSAWGKNYIAVVPKMASGSNDSEPGPQWGQILAMTDNTQVQIVPTVALPGGTGVTAAPQNAVTTYMLNAGEYLQWQNPYTFGAPGAAPMEMSGSIVSSTNPVAFMGGNGYLCLGSSTATGGGCDSGHQQIAPVSALGNEYAPAPYTTRRADLQPESLPYRIVGMVDGTTLTYDPPVTGAPTTLKLGQWVDFEATGAFVVKSQDDKHPFYLGQMMTGCQVTSGSRAPGSCIGDEEYVNVMAPAQFLSSYVFFTDPTYPTTTFTLVRVKTAQGFQDVTVDCMPAPLTGWQPVGSSTTYEWTTVDLVRGGAGTGTCVNGPHGAKSKGPFGLTVWGLAEYASYGYPVGTNLAAINTVVIPPTPQ